MGVVNSYEDVKRYASLLAPAFVKANWKWATSGDDRTLIYPSVGRIVDTLVRLQRMATTIGDDPTTGGLKIVNKENILTLYCDIKLWSFIDQGMIP